MNAIGEHSSPLQDWAPMQFGRLLVIAGVFLVVLGLLVMLGSRFSFFGFGRLPGDIYVRRGSFSFYFPIATSVVLILAFLKIQLVGAWFMELEHAPVRLVLTFSAWVVLTCTALITIYVAA